MLGSTKKKRTSNNDAHLFRQLKIAKYPVEEPGSNDSNIFDKELENIAEKEATVGSRGRDMGIGGILRDIIKSWHSPPKDYSSDSLPILDLTGAETGNSRAGIILRHITEKDYQYGACTKFKSSGRLGEYNGCIHIVRCALSRTRWKALVARVKAFVLAGSSSTEAKSVIEDYPVKIVSRDLDLILAGDGTAYYGVVHSIYDYLHNSGAKFQVFDNSSYEGSSMCGGVVEFTIDGLEKPIQVIWYPKANNREQILNSSDISVCKVGYDLQNLEFFMADGVEEDLKSGTASVTCEFKFASNVPSKEEIYSLNKALKRMRKYSLRGYKFKNGPMVAFKSS